MRILWINHRDPMHPQAGGAEVRLYEISKRLVRKGHEITVISEKIRETSEKDTIEGIKIKRMGNKISIHLLVPLYLKKHGQKYDVIIDDIAHAVPWYSPKMTKTPVIAQIHHVHQDILNIELPKLLAWVITKAEKTIPKIYENFITVSDSTKKELVEKLGVKPEKIKVIPNGVDTSKYKPGQKSQKPTIIWVGRIKKYKNLDHLLKAYKEVKQEIPETQLVIIGTGDQEQKMKQLARKLNLKDTYFLGKATEEEKIKWMQKSWIIASTSQKEGWGITILEAAACKTPAIAYNVPGLKDSVQHMKTGILVQPGNIKELAEKTIEILENTKLRNTLAKNAYQNAKQFTWERISQRFLETIEAVTYG